MVWSTALQEEKERVLLALIERCRIEVGHTYVISPDTDPCRHLGLCEEDLDDIQIDACAAIGLRPPLRGEHLILPWSGPNAQLTLEAIAGWLATNARPLD